ncbi:hypothetical protein BDQ17DRAFT_1426635 [Cyathus striatus]|nr:hypothetical protein BDQ17DRAFT_1426635 [Cyathus striatus]
MSRFSGIKKHLLVFLSSGKQYTGPLYSTPEDFAELFTIISSHTGHNRHRVPLEDWTKNLNIINPAITPQLTQSLESAARDFHDNDQFRLSLTHTTEEYLLSWLKTLPDPPLKIIDAWQKAFVKAKRATQDRMRDYRYFCSPYMQCPTGKCHDNSEVIVDYI